MSVCYLFTDVPISKSTSDEYGFLPYRDLATADTRLRAAYKRGGKVIRSAEEAEASPLSSPETSDVYENLPSPPLREVRARDFPPHLWKGI